MRRRPITWWWLAWLLAASGMQGFGSVSLQLPPHALVEGLALGAATRSYEPASLTETLDTIRRAGAAVVELHAGQAIASGQADVVVGEGMTVDETYAVRRQATATGMRLVAARVRFGSNASAITRLFEWADRMGIQVLVGDPPLEQYDHVERMVRQYNIAVGLPTAGARGPGGRGGWTDPKTVLGTLRGRDPRIGVVINLLNLVRAGVEPFAALEDLRSRLVGIQLVDLSDLSTQARAVPFGKGKFDFKRLLTELEARRFGGYVVFDPPPDLPEFQQDVSLGIEFCRREMESIRRSNSLRHAARGATVPDGLRYEVLVQGEIPEPVKVVNCPDGSVWFGSRRGMVWEWSPETRTNRMVARFSVSTSGQRGLYGFEFDPGFLTNGWVYVYRSPILSSGNSNRVSRFTAVGGRGSWQIDLGSEHALLEIPSSSHGVQQGGGLLLHPREGHLYVGTGDNISPEDTPRIYDDPRSTPQNLGDLRGKILRIRTDGTIPADNPFMTMQDARAEVFAYGLRNPFTLTWHAAAGEVLAGDVGFDRIRDWEEVNQIRPGANYGWPRCDGRDRDTLSGAACPLPDVVPPWFAYPHDSAGAVMVGPVIGTGLPGWPDAYQSGLIYSDFSRRTIRFAQIDGVHNAVTNTIPFVSGLAGGVLSMTLTASGELYLVEYAGNRSGSPDDRLSRILPAAK